MEETPEPPLAPATNAAIKVIRDVLGLDQRQAAELAGISPGALGKLELGKAKEPLAREQLDQFAAHWKAAPGAAESALTAVRSIRPDEVVHTLGADLPTEIRVDLERAAARISREVRRELFAGARDRMFDLARAQAAAMWVELRSLQKQPAARRSTLERMPVAPTWALVEKLAHESDRATVRDLEESICLAELGIWVAERLVAPEALQAASREYAWVYLGNARRAEGAFDQANIAYVRAKDVAPPVGFPSPFSRARMLDAEAKLYRDQRRFGGALALQDQAFEAAQPGELGFLWLSRAVLLQHSNDSEGAIGALQNACATFDERSDPRDRLVAQFNLAANLVELGRGVEAVALLPQIRALAESRREALDLIRVLWLEGRVAAATGRFENAIAALDQVWRDFAAIQISYDAALAALDLAEVYLSTGRPAETKILARQTLAIFRSLRIEREELAAVRLFLDAAERDRATAELARQAHRALVAASAPAGNGVPRFGGGTRG
ncbi:MAG: hypothetical protein ABJC13_24070 [Acidobacteriota bacterium]